MLVVIQTVRRVGKRVTRKVEETMTSIIRPTLILKMSLDQHVCTKEDIDGIKRAYSYIAPVLARELPECAQEDAHNNLRFTIKLRRPYWDANDQDSCAQWDAVMPKWLRNMLYKVFSTVTAANTQFADRGQLAMPYRWLELDFEGNALICIKTDSNSNVDNDAVLEAVEQVRKLYAQGVLDDSVACVRIPSAASYEAQLEQARAEEQSRAEEEASDVAAAVDETADAEATDIADADAAAQPEEPAFAWPHEPAFDIDMSTWGIEYADDTVREFDSAAGAFEE